MPPKKKTGTKVSAPANRTYKAVAPLVQTTLPPPQKKRRVSRSYGKKMGVRLEKQDTLTQMDFVTLRASEEDVEDDIEDSDGIYEDEDSKRRTKRRKTMGDVPTKGIKKESEKKYRRKTLGEDRATPNYQTQTITQLDWSFSTALESEAEEVKSIDDFRLSTSPAAPQPRRSSRKLGSSKDSPQKGTLKLPQTPTHKRLLEIPSSQSPVTPPSSQFGGSSRRRSPLKEQSTNIAIPFSMRSKVHVSPDKLPQLRVADTFETGTEQSQILRTPSKKSSPMKTVRFAVPSPTLGGLEAETPTKREKWSQAAISSTMTHVGTKKPVNLKYEILDSDAEEDEDEDVQILDSEAEEEQDDEEENVQIIRDVQKQMESEILQDEPLSREQPVENEVEELTRNDTLFKEGSEAEDEDLQIGSRNSEEQPHNQEQSVRDKVLELHEDGSRLEEDVMHTETDVIEQEQTETCYGDIGIDTQFEAERIMTSSSNLSSIAEKTPSGGEESPEAEIYSSPPRASYLPSQYQESQRLSTQHFNAMAPRSDASDIFVSIHPKPVEDIISRKKDHEFRAYSFPAATSRIWIYQTVPVKRLAHMAVIGAPKMPGEITNLDGLGNAKFNSGGARSSKFAYEILELYELANPMSYEKLLERQWFKAAPQKWAKVPPAVQGELLANLKPPIFTQVSSPSPTESSSNGKRSGRSSTESQEVAEQINSTIQQFTQAPPSSPPTTRQAFVSSQAQLSSSPPHQQVPASFCAPATRYNFQSSHPSQATTVDYTQTQTPRTPHRHNRHSSPLPEFIPESPTKSIPSSSPSNSLPSPINRNPQNESAEQSVQAPSSTPLPYSLIRSSQMITSTQLIREQDSLLDREIMGPPKMPWRDVDADEEVEVGDSDDELV